MDVANDIAIVGGIDNTANLIIELCDTTEPDIEALVALSEYYPVAAARRLGYLMETFTEVSGLENYLAPLQNAGRPCPCSIHRRDTEV